MRTATIALLASLVLAVSALLLSPSDVESKGQWPMTWSGTRSTSDTFLVGIRRDTDIQHQIGVLEVRKRPGHHQACSATLYVTWQGMKRGEGLTLTTSEPTWTSEAWAWWWDMSDAREGAKMHMTMSLRTNGHCQWLVVLSGPRVGEPEFA